MKVSVIDYGESRALHNGKRILSMVCCRDKVVGISWFINGAEYLMMRLHDKPVWVLGDAQHDVVLLDIPLHEDLDTALAIAVLLADRTRLASSE